MSMGKIVGCTGGGIVISESILSHGCLFKCVKII